MTRVCQVKFHLLLLTIFSATQLTAQYDLRGFDLEGDIYQWHDKALGYEKTGILRGSYKPFERKSRSSHSFHRTDSWEANAISYRGEIYDSTFILYDTFEDIVLIRHPTNFGYFAQPIKPTQEMVSWFQFRSHTFKYYQDKILIYEPGFYDELYTGKHFDLLGKRVKILKIETVSQIDYIQDDAIILRHNNEYLFFKGKRSIIQFLKNEKKVIKQYIRENNLTIKTEYEQDIIQLVQFCDQLLMNK